MKNSIFVILVIASLGCAASKETTREVKIDYEPVIELSEVLEIAKAKEKIIFMDVGASWCLPCKMMDDEVFSDEPTAEFINEHFISHKVDPEKLEGPEILLMYNVDVFPTLLWLDEEGEVLERHNGAMGIQAFNELAEDVLEDNRLAYK